MLIFVCYAVVATGACIGAIQADLHWGQITFRTLLWPVSLLLSLGHWIGER